MAMAVRGWCAYRDSRRHRPHCVSVTLMQMAPLLSLSLLMADSKLCCLAVVVAVAVEALPAALAAAQRALPGSWVQAGACPLPASRQTETAVRVAGLLMHQQEEKAKKQIRSCRVGRKEKE